MDWAIGKQFPLQQDVRVRENCNLGQSETLGMVVNFTDLSVPLVLKEGTIVEFVQGVRNEYYDFKVIETLLLFRVYEDDLVEMDINPLWY